MTMALRADIETTRHLARVLRKRGRAEVGAAPHGPSLHLPKSPKGRSTCGFSTSRCSSFGHGKNHGDHRLLVSRANGGRR